MRELQGCEVEWAQGETSWTMKELAGTDFSMKVDLVLLAMGFKHVVHGGLVESLGLERDASGNVKLKDIGLYLKDVGQFPLVDIRPDVQS